MDKAFGTISEAVYYSGLSRSAIYQALKNGELTARKAGRRTLISFEELDQYLTNLPEFGKAG